MTVMPHLDYRACTVQVARSVRRCFFIVFFINLIQLVGRLVRQRTLFHIELVSVVYLQVSTRARLPPVFKGKYL